ncbi:uncharacterized protein LOC119574413 [Penaeus monodon]|uniref:uncharacterized protein LOC119574413 n=1 Tax=Penaeus monodon TaxID=6687 RepID=UPI0018A70053|nr:uncharacterized protein LOC119574413 [Penaeus monodon]
MFSSPQYLIVHQNAQVAAYNDLKENKNNVLLGGKETLQNTFWSSRGKADVKMRKVILLLMNLAVFAMVISSVDSDLTVKGSNCQKAGGECYRNRRANKICKKYDDDANDCGQSSKCCLVTTGRQLGITGKANKCTESCDVGTCTPKNVWGKGWDECGKRCVCCTNGKYLS